MAGITPGSREDREQGLRAALGTLVRRLRELSTDGAVKRDDFLAATSGLDLSGEELERLAQQLKSFGLKVADEAAAPSRRVTSTALHPTPPPPATTRPPGTSEQCVLRLGPRVTTALELARRYMGTGLVTDRLAHDVGRLCGLDIEETQLLATALAAQQPKPPTVRTQPAHDQTSPSEGRRAELVQRVPSPLPAPASPAVKGKDSAEIAAATALLEQRRFLRRPAKRLLSAQEEVGLALLMRGQSGHAARTPLTERDLAALPREDVCRRAYDAMVEHNMGLVHEVRKKYTGQGVEDEDLVHYGVLGLMHAVCKFDMDRGFKFSTYAYHWIRQAMSRAVADYGRAIRIPVHLHEEMHKAAAAEARLRARGQSATPAAVALATGLTVTRVEEIRRISRVTDSLDRELFEGANLADVLSLELPSEGPEELLRFQWSRDDVEQRVLARLDAKSADILRRRSGLIDQQVQTLEAIGSDYGVTRERIRQIETRARNRVKELLVEEQQEHSATAAAPRPTHPHRILRPTAQQSATENEEGHSAWGLASAAQRMVAGLGRTALEHRAGPQGARIIRAIADGRLPGSASSTRLRQIIMGHGLTEQSEPHDPAPHE
ncbi:RNA polymerase sigma factor RpoD/SigA [Streptomyces sp. NPDC059491]|uniref:sigma-70 family RNA polymerase sigma factor n=1 Tax=Streptomyces sp. NPDC059491 TaxID=3346850 RepID=UPI0036CF5CC8